MKHSNSYIIEAHKANLVKMVERKKEIQAHLASGESINSIKLPGVTFVKPL